MKYLLVLVTAVIAMLFLFWKKTDELLPSTGKPFAARGEKNDDRISVLNKWEMPSALREVSGIAYLDEERFLAVQDEIGTLFTFNRNSGQIEKQITFAGQGDFEGLAVLGNTAYIVSADGKIYEQPLEGQAKAAVYATTLTGKNNVEGLCADGANHRLLLAVKDRDPSGSDYKGVYAFDLRTKTFSTEPVYKIALDDPIFGSKKKKTIMPSAIGIHPLTGELYVVDGPNSRLLILDKEGKAIRLIDLGKEFAQPEGISFSPAGSVFIANEGNRDPGNIIEIRIGQ